MTHAFSAISNSSYSLCLVSKLIVKVQTNINVLFFCVYESLVLNKNICLELFSHSEAKLKSN